MHPARAGMAQRAMQLMNGFTFDLLRDREVGGNFGGNR